MRLEAALFVGVPWHLGTARPQKMKFGTSILGRRGILKRAVRDGSFNCCRATGISKSCAELPVFLAAFRLQNALGSGKSKLPAWDHREDKGRRMPGPEKQVRRPMSAC